MCSIHYLTILFILLFLISYNYYNRYISTIFLLFILLIQNNNSISILCFLLIAILNYSTYSINEHFNNPKELEFIKFEDKQKDKPKQDTEYKIDTDLNSKLDLLKESLQIFKQQITSSDKKHETK